MGVKMNWFKKLFSNIKEVPNTEIKEMAETKENGWVEVRCYHCNKVLEIISITHDSTFFKNCDCSSWNKQAIIIRGRE